MKVILDRHADRLQDHEHSEKVPEDDDDYKLTDYELFQLERYGNILPNYDERNTNEENDGILELNRLNEYFEAQLLKDHP